MTKMILVRHGETEANVNQVWQGSLDAPLTRRGMLQVKHTADRIAELAQEHPIDHFYVSPLPRARSTAAAIAATIRQEPAIYDGVREFDLGDWEGRTFQDLREGEDLWNRWAADPSFAPPNGESPIGFGTRIRTAFETLAADHANETMIIVTHGGVIANLLASWLGNGPEEWRDFDTHNCAISVLERTPARWRGLIVNDISHLPPAARVMEDTSAWALEEEEKGAHAEVRQADEGAS